MDSDGSEIIAARCSHCSAVKGDCKFPFTCLLPLWLCDRSPSEELGSARWLQWGNAIQETWSCSEALGETRAGRAQFLYVPSLCPLLVLLCRMFQDQVFSKRFDGESRTEASLPFPLFCSPPAPRGETCLQVLAEVLSPARGGGVGCRSGSGWLQLIPTQREPRPSAHVLCYEQSGVVLVWGPPATSSGLGNIDERKEAGQDAASHSCFTCWALIHLPFVRQHLCSAI